MLPRGSTKAALLSGMRAKSDEAPLSVNHLAYCRFNQQRSVTISRLDPTTLFSMLSSLPHGLPRVGAHEAKRDQPVELFRKERVRKAETESDRLCSRARRASYLSVLEQSSAPQARTTRLFGDAGDYCVESRAQRQEKGLGEILQAIYRIMGDKIRLRL